MVLTWIKAFCGSVLDSATPHMAASAHEDEK
jgi:hypothetical protein